MLLSSFFPILLAILALSFIIFLHELGHLLAALAVGMKVNTFSVGFGPAIKSWKWRDIEWRLSWIPLGGYVSIHGMDDGETGQGSYYGASVYKRLIVIAMGPIVNIALAWAIFAGIHADGGMPKAFSEATSIVGWVDPSSQLAKFVKPGDRILGYDGKNLSSAKDHLYLPLMSKGQMSVEFESIDYAAASHRTETAQVNVYSHPEAADPSLKTAGVLSSARWLVIDGFSEGSTSYIDSLAHSGAQIGDRIVAINGQRVFSDRQLLASLNENSVRLAVEREGQTLIYKVPRIALSELGDFPAVQLEWRDWLFDISHEKPILERYCLPLDISSEGSIQAIASKETDQGPRVGDRLVSINGVRFENAKQLCELLQSPFALVTLYRPQTSSEIMAFEESQKSFDQIFASSDLQALLERAVIDNAEVNGSFIQCKPVQLIAFENLARDQLKEWKNRAQLIVEEASRVRMMQLIEQKRQEKVLGVRLSDEVVLLNPSSNVVMWNAVKQIGWTLNALLTGQLSPKWVAGPVGMVTVITQSFSVSLKQVFYWLAMISLNLGLFNLLPLPIFDGGRIILELVEGLTGRRIPSQVMEFLTYALVVGLIGLSLVATYWDISRLSNLLGA